MRVALALATAAVLGCATASPPPLPGPAELAVVVEPELRIELGCSEIERRMPVATVTWRPDAARQLDVTPFKDGYERGWYASISIAGEITFAPARARMGVEPGRPFAFEARPRVDRERGVAVVDVRNLEPGVIYFWRAGREIVETEAPVCPFDEADVM